MKNLVDRINKSQEFLLLANETADIAGIEQVSICFRYLKKNNQNQFVIQEDFLSFVQT